MISSKRPASADAVHMNSNLDVCKQAGFCGSDRVLAWEGNNGIDEEYMRYAYTAESARLLESLLREPWRSDESSPEKLTSRQKTGDGVVIDTERTSSSGAEVPSKDSGRTGSLSFLQEKESEETKDTTPALIDFSKEALPNSHRDSTLEDLVNILNVLENEEGRPVTPPPSPENQPSKINDFFHYLDQAERCSDIIKPINRTTNEALESSIPR